MDAGSGIMRHLDDFQIIPFKTVNTYNSPYVFPELHLTFPKGISRNELFHHKDREKIGGTTTGIIWLVIIISQDHPMTPDGL